MAVLQCSLHAIRDSFLPGLFQRQSFGLQTFTDSIPHIFMKRTILEENTWTLKTFLDSMQEESKHNVKCKYNYLDQTIYYGKVKQFKYI